MRLLDLTLVLALASSACTISPVIPISEVGDTRSGQYEDCRRAAKAYCKEVERPSDSDMKRCVAEATYTCVSKR